MGGLGEPVDYRQNDSVAIRQREPSDKVQIYEIRNNEEPVEARRSLPWSLVLSTHSACGDEGRDVKDHCGPPETLSKAG